MAVDKSKFRTCSQSPHCRPKEVKSFMITGVEGVEDGTVRIKSTNKDEYFIVTAFTDHTVNIQSSFGQVRKQFEPDNTARKIPWMPVFPGLWSSMTMMSTDGNMDLTVGMDGITFSTSKGMALFVDLSRLEFEFEGDNIAFHGLPLHTTPLHLPITLLQEPIRFYNSDVFEYELNSTMALYGAIPMVMARQVNTTRAIGVFYNDPSDLFVDITDRSCRFMADPSTGNAVDVWLYLSGTIKEVIKQHCSITGFPMMPPLFALGYHQCRWNYKDSKDVLSVDNGFDSHGIPYDVIWLDIEHTDDKRYFTFDTFKFPNITQLTSHLDERGKRKLVVIVDPHIKVDPEWSVYKELLDNNFAVKSKTGKPFEGDCWPGRSVWVDYFNEKARNWWSSLFSKHYPQHNIHIWNDMNEPAVFNIPELSFPRDNIHTVDSKQVSHNAVHNLYGQWMHMSTRDGLLKRSPKQRPFVLSRSFYAGTQSIGPIWTGDNAADWSHLQASIPMILSLGLTGMPFTGADVGGFFGDPDAELLTRWYQLGALQPFFRGHAHIDTKRREPWLFGEPWTTAIRKAIRLRYRLLPHIYTVMFMAHRHGTPVNRPIFMEFPEYTMQSENMFMIGDALLFNPIVNKNVTDISIDLPVGTKWYDFHTHKLVNTPHKQSVNLFSMPLFMRGGHIITTKEMPRRSTAAASQDPLSIMIALDHDMEASGLSYIDSGDGFEYLQGNRCLSELTFKNMILTNRPFKGQITKFVDSSVTIRDITIMGLPSGHYIPSNDQVQNYTINADSGALKIIAHLGAIRLDKEWSLRVI